MKIESMKCIWKLYNNNSEMRPICPSCTDGMTHVADFMIMNVWKYCPFCGKEINIQE